MICIYCKSDIEDDSFYCDQCGKELFICPICGKSGKGKRCVNDGGVLYSARLMNSTKSEQFKKNKFENATDPLPQIQVSEINKSDTTKSILRLINKILNIDIEIRNNTIIGTKSGDHTGMFSKYSEISGKHLEINYDDSNGWTVMDTGSDGLGSTNGTKINDKPQWENTPKIKPNNPVRLKGSCYILIAEKYEFYVRIINQPSLTPTGTLRL